MTESIGGHVARLTTLSTVLACLALLSAGAVQALATTYYVCNDSSCPNALDTNSGTSEEYPWKTIERVNAQPLSPGDTVLLHGGDAFKEHGLWPSSSGSANNPVVYGSYGTGHAILKKEVWIPPHRSWVTIENLTVDGSEQGGATNEGVTGIAGGAEGYDEHISVLDNTLQNLGIAIRGAAPKTAFSSDNNWLISGNTINNIGESGIYVEGEAFTIERNTIEHTGLDENKPNKAHGVYLRARNSNVVSNVIAHFASAGVSVRYRNSRVEGNTITYGPIGVSWYQYDHLAGTSTWRNNVISHIEEDAFYVSPSQYEEFETELNEDNLLYTQESFVITNNVMLEAGGDMELNATTGTYTVTGNTPCNVTHPPGFCFGVGGTPSVTTDGASSVTSTGAELTGALNQERSETTYHFEYGTTTSYGINAPVPDANVGVGESSQEVSEAITGLEEGKTYYFRLVATNSIGTSYGSEQAFTTPNHWSQSGALSSAVAAGTSPSAFALPNGGERAYFVGASNDAIHELEYNPGSGWSQSGALSSAVAAGTSPSAFALPNGGERAYFVGASDDAIHELAYN
jgi:parallel beta-helix repeat protein